MKKLFIPLLVLLLIANVANCENTNQESDNMFYRIVHQFSTELRIPHDTPFGTRSGERCNYTIESGNGYVYSHVEMVASSKWNVSSLLDLTQQDDDLAYYKPGVNCRITVTHPDPGWKYLIRFRKGASLVSGDSLTISTGSNTVFTLTDSNDDGWETYSTEVPNNNVTFTFVTGEDSAGAEGFFLQYSVFFRGNNCSLGDSEGGFLCDTDRCVPGAFKCDGVEQCLDGTDELEETAGCSWLDKALGKLLSIGVYGVLGALLALLILLLVITCVCVKLCCCKKGDNVRSLRTHRGQPAWA